MKKLWLVIGAGIREQARWARQHLYTLLILSPLVFGISYATLARLAEEAPQWQPSFTLGLIMAFVFVRSLIGLSLTRASGEIYHLRRPESVLDALPVPLATQLHAALLKRVLRTSIVALLILIVRSRSGGGRFFDAPVLVPLLLFTLILSLAEALAALSWIHWGHTRNKFAALGAMLAISFSAIIGASLLVLMLRHDGWQGGSDNLLIAAGTVWAIALYLLTRMLHGRWRAFDIEYAKRLEAGSQLHLFHARRLERSFERPIAVQLARDLQLTFRVFSSAVYVALFISLILVAALATVLTTGWLATGAVAVGWFEATWLPGVMATKIACVLVSFSSSMLVSVLLAYQLSYFWLERAVGTTGKQMWETKLWYARLISLPAPLVVWLVGVFSGAVPVYYVIPLLAECLWLWWLVSSLTGSLAFEIPDRPELAIVVMISSAGMFGLVVAGFWPAGLILLVVNGMRSLAQRGQARAHYCLVTEGD